MMRANRSKDGSLSVDTLGLVLRVLVTAASVGEREGGKQVLKRVEQMHKMCRLTTIWVDGGFDGVPFMQWVMDVCRWAGCAATGANQGFVLLKTVGGRAHLRLMGCRRLVRDYELLPETETFIYLAMIRIMVRRLA